MFIHSMYTYPRYDDNASNDIVYGDLFFKKDHRPDQNQDIQDPFPQIRRRQRNQLQQKLPHNSKDTKASDG